MPGSSASSMEQIKAQMRAAWMAGDFGQIAKTGAASAEAFVAGLDEARPGVLAGCRALDIACGTGNTALPLARRGARVRGVDIAPNLLAQARERAAAEGLAIAFDEGDAEQLPYPDGSFDLVVSMFGAMFAPQPVKVAEEIARVLRPGGVLAMGNWTPGSFTGRMFKVGSDHAPPPPGVAPPVLWGDAGVVRERLAADFDEIRTDRMPLEFDLPTDAAGAVRMFRTYFGPTQVAFGRLGPEEQAAFARDLEALWAGANVAPDPAQHLLVPNEYLRVTAVRR